MSIKPNSLFRLSTPSNQDIESFHNDGYIAYPDIFTDDGREGLIEEITQQFEPTRQYIEALQNGEKTWTFLFYSSMERT